MFDFWSALDRAMGKEASTKYDQPEPTQNELPAIWDLVMDDMRERDTVGLKRYGTRLQPHNGRHMLRDAYEEILDQAVYIRGAMYEQEVMWKVIEKANALVAGKKSLGQADTAELASLIGSISRKKTV